MNLFIIEDEVVAAERIRELIRQIDPDARIVGWADSVDASVQFLQTHKAGPDDPDLILMDIELVDGQSFEIFQEVEITCPVIFTTAYDEYALRAFKVHSIDYLLKPIQREELHNSLTKFRQLSQVYKSVTPTFDVNALIDELRRATAPTSLTHREHFLVRQGQRLISVGVDEVAYFYSEDRVTFLKAHDGRYFPVDQTLEEVELQIDERQFFRASRQYLVARPAVTGVYVHLNGKLKLTLKPAINEMLFVSRDRAPEFKKWLGG
ncbi:response regulator transcription factor [Spirosoma taeanense]|uniref:Response regulator transcription factor n=1 Tax=Spirosoma taeanense TaxID=2735870 RepID=A0A6M5Y888_9BACT|nr:LytTR family DNA-binding domain-containing protein [Spirosoma taeanense]QJW90537.1 response regulator transcription factor [Spirosoma taeanense]